MVYYFKTMYFVCTNTGRKLGTGLYNNEHGGMVRDPAPNVGIKQHNKIFLRSRSPFTLLSVCHGLQRERVAHAAPG